MSVVGKLCHHFTASSRVLVYKSGGVHLVYKAKPIEDCAIRIPWNPQSYICVAANTYHELSLDCTWGFTSGSGTVVSAPSATTDITTAELLFKITPSGGAIFEVNISVHSPCSASYTEDPGVKCDVFATQPSTIPKYMQGIAIPRDTNSPSSVSISFTFDSAGVLSGIVR